MHIDLLTSEDYRKAAENAEANGRGFLIPLFDLVAKGHNFLHLPPNKKPFAIPAHMKHQAWIALMTDGFTDAAGPSGYHLKSLIRLLKGADIVVMMVAVPRPAVYAAAAWAASDGYTRSLGLAGTANTVVIETSHDERQSWSKFLDRHAPKARQVITKPD